MSSPAAPASRLSIREKLSFGAAGVPFTLAYLSIGALAYPIFNITLGMNATLIGTALAIGRFWDAFTDPFMGSYSDNARTRWGRRRPFVLLGAILCAVIFPIFWFVPRESSQTFQFIWLLSCLLLFYSATTIYSVPFLSLGYELNPDPVERTRLQVWRGYFAGIAGLGMPWLYRLAQFETFGDTITGMRVIGLGCGAIFFVFALPLVLNCRERMDATALKPEKVPFIRGVKETFSNRAFLLLVFGIVSTMLCAPTLIGSLSLYINSYYIFPGDTKAGASYAALFGTVYALLNLAFLPLGVKLVARFGKIRVVRWALIVSLLGTLSKLVFYTPVAPWMQFLTALLLAPALSCFWLLVDPLKADCADYDEWKTGNRRSGSYAAVANWIEKAAMTLFLFFAGVLLDVSGFDPQLGGNQAEGTLWIWRIAFAGLPALAYSIALVCLHFYPLTDERMAEIRKALADRAAEMSRPPHPG